MHNNIKIEKNVHTVVNELPAFAGRQAVRSFINVIKIYTLSEQS
jgi:hypothetical protein